MKCFSIFALLFIGGMSSAAAGKAQANPLGMVLSLMDDLTAKLMRLGEEEDAAYVKYFEWCDDTSKNAQNTITTLTNQKKKLEAKISQLTADIEINDDKIAKLVADIEKDTKDLKDATLIREKEQAEFEAAEAELVEGIDTLSRAIAIIGRDMEKNPAALAQIDTSNLNNALKALSTVLDAASFSAADKSKLTALIQSRQNSDDQDPGAPAPSVYKTHSGGIMEVLEDMKEEAEEQLTTLRREDTASKNNFQMLKQSLEDSIAADNKDKKDEEADKAANEEAKATAEGDLAITNKDLAETTKALETCRNDCMQTATDHEASTKGREEEIAVIAKAKKVLQETTSGAASETYSLIQTRMQSRADLAQAEVVEMVQQLAKKHHSAGLVQLASRISAVLRYGNQGGADPFAKVKGLISDMIAKLEKQAKEDAAEKAYCDDQMAKTEQNKVELDEDIAKLNSKIDKAASRSAELKDQVKTLQAELAALAKEQANLDKVREEEHAVFLEAQSDLKLGLEGVGTALKQLRTYYEGPQEAATVDAGQLMSGEFVQQPAMPEFHGKAAGAGGSIIGILEVVESDFAKELALEEKTEADSEAEYQEVTQENKVTQTTKQQDVKYKTQEFVGLDKAIADLTSDRETAQTSLDAVMEYYAKIKDRCIAKPETYEQIVERRTAEIAGLKEALTILEGETAFAQGKKAGRRHLFLHN